jgi:hypothetical protein
MLPRNFYGKREAKFSKKFKNLSETTGWSAEWLGSGGVFVLLFLKVRRVQVSLVGSSP